MALPLRSEQRFASGFAPVLCPPRPVHEVARTSRKAGLSFLDGTARGWSKRELATWLVNDYREATCHASMPPSRTNTLSLASHAPAAAPSRVESLLELVRIAVVAALAEVIEGAPAFVAEAIASDSVVRSRTAGASGDSIWLPVDAPRMRLESRLLSLFAADYLARPEDYARGRIHVCTECDSFAFIDHRARSTAPLSCTCAPPVSGFRCPTRTP